jgi:hypothetical protein
LTSTAPTRAFGLCLDSTFELPGTWPEAPAGRLPAVRLELAGRDKLKAVLEATDISSEWHTSFPDGNVVQVDRTADNSFRFRYGRVAEYLLSPARDLVQCVPADVREPRWQRFLLDTVLWWTSLAHGYHVLHASAVEGPRGVVLFASQTGGGKTTLALEFLRRGWRLFSDDVVAIRVSDDGPVLHPGPPLMNAPSSEPNLQQLGTAITDIDGETWLSVDQAGTGPRPLAALFLYSRGTARTLGADKAQASPLNLVQHVWDIHIDPDRLRARFELLAEIVETIPVYHLSAHSETPPARIAELVDEVLTEGPSPG